MTGLNKEPGFISAGGNSGHQALNLAYHLGPKRIILLGFDMGGEHWYKDRPDQFNKPSPFEQWIENFQFIANDLNNEGVEVFNCSTNTSLDCFEKVPLEKLL